MYPDSSTSKNCHRLTQETEIIFFHTQGHTRHWKGGGLYSESPKDRSHHFKEKAQPGKPSPAHRRPGHAGSRSSSRKKARKEEGSPGWQGAQWLQDSPPAASDPSRVSVNLRPPHTTSSAHQQGFWGLHLQDPSPGEKETQAEACGREHGPDTPASDSW